MRRWRKIAERPTLLPHKDYAMDAAAIVLALLVAGVNFGWQPADDGSQGFEYIVQVEPELLDALKRGEAVPIESNVPAEVKPIRKVSIVVGRDEVPRQSLGAVNRTAYFAGQDLPDRYGSPTARTTSDVSPPPSVIERAQAAATETATTLHDGIEAGIQAANQQLSDTGEQMLESTRNASQHFGQQMHEFVQNPAREIESAGNNLRDSAEQTIDAVGNQWEQVTSPFTNSNTQPIADARAGSNVGPPPWTEFAAGPTMNDAGQVGGATPVRTPTGWTSIGANVAAPPPIVPQMATAPDREADVSTRMASNGGPQFPAASTGGDAASSNWANGGSIYDSNTPPTIAREGLDSNLVTIEQNRSRAPAAQQAASPPADPFRDLDAWSQQGQAPPAGAGTQNSVANSDAARSGAAEWDAASNRGLQNGNYPMGQMAPPQTGGVASQSNSGGFNNAMQPAGNPTTASSSGQEPPWMPFVLVCLTLVGSLSANLFLGWSYLDARQRYRLLVRKTAETFRRAAAPAA
jgi:hypothetical protein